jgi:hypothetical protein
MLKLFLLIFTLGVVAQAAHWPMETSAPAGVTVRGRPELVDGAEGKALLLRGSEVLEVKGSATVGQGDAGFSLSVWVNPLAAGQGQQMIAGKNRYSADEREWGVMLDKDGRFRLYVWQGGWKTATHEQAPMLGRWHQVGVVLRAEAAELWVNGALSGTAALEQPIPRTRAPLTFGGIMDGTSPRQMLTGALDEARTYDRALSASEMAALYRPVAATLPVPEPIVPVTLWDEKRPVPKAADLPVLKGVRFAVIKPYEFKKDGYRFLHGVGLGFHKGRLYASFGHNRGGENTDTEEARFCVSEDEGRTWSAVKTMDDGGPEFAVSHGVFLSHQGSLWAFMGSYTGTMVGIHTRAYRLNESTGEFEKLGVVVEGGFWPMQEPIHMDDGNWVMSGISAGGDAPAGGKHPAAVAISQGDNFLKWDLVRIPQVPGLGKVWGESAVIVEGKRITNLSRYGSEAVALTATSDDYGRTWTLMRPSNLPMATSKPYAGVLSTGQRYLVCSTSADGGVRRAPLTIAVSRPGETLFSKIFVIRHAMFPGGSGESHERASLSYPYAIEHEGHLYVGYSNNGGNVGRIGEGRELWNNNSAELAVIPVSALK